VGISRAAFAKRFTQLVGMPPLAYVTRWRVELALQQLRETDRTLASIASDVGYESVFAFSRAFKRLLGASPSAYRRTV
jgi:AraC-like DNA-binding protein